MPLASRSQFESLAVRDLLEARQAYHWHLMHKENVISTAIGLYLIRKSDPWPSERAPTADLARKAVGATKGPRTLENSEIRPYSWPCVLVFVKSWVAEERFGGRGGEYRPDAMVPKTLYLPDGRLVPVCVVEAPLDEQPIARSSPWHWPRNLLGGGFPIAVEVQGETHVASVGCLLTDGHSTYALTNRHVCGSPGEPVYAFVRGRRELVGRASVKQLTRRRLVDLYPEFPGARTLVNLDLGLVEIDDVHRWTTQVYGIGRIGPMADLSIRNLTLQLVGSEVLAWGAASGRMRGRIKALFYRYQTVGGHDLVAEFMIEPMGEPLVSSRPGDSGTVWHLVDPNGKEAPRPLAVQWGGHVLGERVPDERCAYALATSLTQACSLLEVDLLRDWNLGAVPYWGKLGHYTIATYALAFLVDPKLGNLMKGNSDRISFATDLLSRQSIDEALKDEEFVPLADVPDLVWKARSRLGRGPQENPTHYADIDEPAAGGGPSLLELCLGDPAKVSVDVWKAFYDAQGHTEPRQRGLLPFRIWQFYRAMTGFAAAGKVADFVAAAGILSHYVGDACQPLHGSFRSDGYRDRPLDPHIVHHQDGTTSEEPRWEGKDVHASYENDMVDFNSEALLELLDERRALGPATPPLGGGQEVAVASVRLMALAQANLPPEMLVDTFIDAGGKKTKAVAVSLWTAFGTRTADVMIEGARLLAAIWEAAWAVGGGAAIPDTKIKKQTKEALRSRYLDKEHFVPSRDLDHIAPELV